MLLLDKTKMVNVKEIDILLNLYTTQSIHISKFHDVINIHILCFLLPVKTNLI